MGYYKKQFDKRGFNTMWTFLQMGHQKPDISQLKKAIQNLMLMMKQKDAGQRNYKNTLDIEENFDMAIITIVCESVNLFLNGDLEKLEEIEKEGLKQMNKENKQEKLKMKKGEMAKKEIKFKNNGGGKLAEVLAIVNK